MTTARINEGATPGKTSSEAAGPGLPGPVVIVAGPTASGKSSLAISLAQDIGGTIINADSMQVYRDIPILTAQPSPDDLQRVPHRLFGFLGIDDACDAQRWASLAVAEIQRTLAAGRVPLVVGGTGLYLRALTRGFSPLPWIPAEARAAARELAAAEGGAGLHRRLQDADPGIAARLHPGDRQRLARAWEVLVATGRPLSWWQSQPPVPLADYRFCTFVLSPERGQLYAAADGRFRSMMAAGALDEVRRAEALRRHEGGAARGGYKALGYRELVSLADGRLGEEAAVAAAQQQTRRYAKRQLTWFRHQVANANFITPDLPDMKFSQRYEAEMRHKIRNFLLTP